MTTGTAHERALAFFEGIWRNGDSWQFSTSPYEQARYARLAELLEARRYERALEIGCGNGCFTRRLATRADQVVALDVAPTAIEQARAAVPFDHVEFRVADVMQFEFDREGPWDLVVMSETIYYLGWLHPFFDVAWLAVRIAAATKQGGHLLMANTFGGTGDYLCRPWAICTYHDLFRHVGFGREREEVFQGVKDGADLEVLITLFTRSADNLEPSLNASA